MAQFDVYVNPSKKTRSAYPFILDIQNAVIYHIATRIVVPLAHTREFKNGAMGGLTPRIGFNGDELLIMIPQIASMPAKLLNQPIGTLEHLRDEIIAALDFAITGI
jgi:toxin CcdB